EGTARFAKETRGNQSAASNSPRYGWLGRGDAVAHCHAQCDLSYVPGLRERAQGDPRLGQYQPAKAERLIVILLTELKCYAFLRTRFAPEDLRWRRLQLREAEYRNEVIHLYDEVMVKPHAKHAIEWRQAQETIPSLESRYKEALNHDLASA